MTTARKTIVGTNACFGGPATTATIDSSNNPSNAIVNNLNVTFPSSENILRSSEEGGVQAVTYGVEPDVTVVQPSVERTFSETAVKEDDREILAYLVKTFHDIITTDAKSVINIIDQSGLVVLGANQLISLIAKVMGIQENCVKIEIEEEVDLGCCGMAPSKISPLKPVRKIKVNKDGNFTDLELSFNGIYNKIMDDYCISLEKVYEPLI